MCKISSIVGRSAIILVAFLLITMSWSTVLLAQEKPKFSEIKGYFGWEEPVYHPSPTYDYNQWWLALTVGKEYSKRLSASIDVTYGNLGWDNHKHLSQIGLVLNGRLALLDLTFAKWFVEGGVGLGLSETCPSKNTLGPNPIGILTYGTGLQIPIKGKTYLLAEYKFWHNSSVFHSDTGINTHGPIIGLGWKW